MDEEKEDSNENETFSRRHCCSSQEDKKCKKLLKLVFGWQLKKCSHSFKVLELQIENWIESGQHHQKNGHKFLFFPDQLYLILMPFFLLINTSPNFLIMTFWIKLCNSPTFIFFSKISTNHWTSLQQTWKNGWVSFISQYQNYQSRRCTGQKTYLSLIMHLKGMLTIQMLQAIIKTIWHWCKEKMWLSFKWIFFW